MSSNIWKREHINIEWNQQNSTVYLEGPADNIMQLNTVFGKSVSYLFAQDGPCEQWNDQLGCFYRLDLPWTQITEDTALPIFYKGSSLKNAKERVCFHEREVKGVHTKKINEDMYTVAIFFQAPDVQLLYILVDQFLDKAKFQPSAGQDNEAGLTLGTNFQKFGLQAIAETEAHKQKCACLKHFTPTSKQLEYIMYD
jgi:hypothetical protein